MLEILSEPQRWAIPAVLIVSAIGAALALWWERLNPTSYKVQQQKALNAAGVDSTEAWSKLPHAAQESADTASLDLAEQAKLDAEAAAEEAAQLAVDRAVQINSLTHP